jgi:hypothetical protein
MFLLIQVVGGAIMWARFRALELPAARGVSLLSPEYLLAVGLSALFWALLLGLVAAGFLYAARHLLSRGLEAWAAIVVTLTLEVALAIVVLEVPLTGRQRLLAISVGLLAGLAFLILAIQVRPRRLGIALLFTVALVGGALGFIRNYGPPAKLELAFIFLKEGGITSGAYVASTGDEVLLAPDSFNRTYGQIVGIPRKDIVRVSYSEPQNFRAAGAHDPRALLGAHPRDEGEREAAVEKYFAAWAGDPMWRYPPISFLESETFLRSHLGEFFPTKDERWKDTGARVPLAKLVSDARSYAGRALITSGRIRQVLRVPAGNKSVTHFLTLNRRGRDHRRLVCGVGTGPSTRFPEGRNVEVRGVVVAAGSLAVGSATHVEGAFMQCSAARLVR